MKQKCFENHFYVGILLLTFAIHLLPGCKRPVYDAAEEQYEPRLQQGLVTKGMTPQDVEGLLGPPDEVRHEEDNVQLWIYYEDERYLMAKARAQEPLLAEIRVVIKDDKVLGELTTVRSTFWLP